MFRNYKPLNEAQLREIRSFGNTLVGQQLSDYLESEVNAFINGILKADATDVAQIAYSQGGSDMGKKIWGLLNNEIDHILEEHNIEPEVT